MLTTIWNPMASLGCNKLNILLLRKLYHTSDLKYVMHIYAPNALFLTFQPYQPMDNFTNCGKKERNLMGFSQLPFDVRFISDWYGKTNDPL